MFHGIENELSNGETWSFTQYSQLPVHIQLLVEKEDGQRDIWELPYPQSESNIIINLLSQYFKNLIEAMKVA
ncbi:hypothetical protein NIES22_01550 [Calothrix brevissima NIES-22]|nr:hypothetical protein NIES22_01550 [Calothrix brevissima NIES-22]